MGGGIHQQDIRPGTLGKGNPAQYNYDAIAAHLNGAKPAELLALSRGYAHAKGAFQQVESDLAKHANRLRTVWKGDAQDLGMGDFKRLVETATTLAEASAKFEAATSEAAGVIRAAPASLPKKTAPMGLLPKPGPPDGSIVSYADDKAAQEHLTRVNTQIDDAYTQIPESIALNLPDGPGQKDEPLPTGGESGGAPVTSLAGAEKGGGLSRLGGMPSQSVGGESVSGVARPSGTALPLGGGGNTSSDLQGTAPPAVGGGGGPGLPGGLPFVGSPAGGGPSLPNGGGPGLFPGLGPGMSPGSRGLNGPPAGTGGMVPGRSGPSPSPTATPGAGLGRSGIPGTTPMMPASGVIGGPNQQGRGTGPAQGSGPRGTGAGPLTRGGVIGPSAAIPPGATAVRGGGTASRPGAAGAGRGALGMPMGAAGAQRSSGGQDRERQAWLIEDDSVWAEDRPIAPRVIGKPEDMR